MADNRQPEPPRPLDVDVRRLTQTAVILIVLAIILHVAVWLLFDLYAAWLGNPQVPIVDASQMPAPPRLAPPDLDERLLLPTASPAAVAPDVAAMQRLLQEGVPVQAPPRHALPLPGPPQPSNRGYAIP